MLHKACTGEVPQAIGTSWFALGSRTSVSFLFASSVALRRFLPPPPQQQPPQPESWETIFREINLDLEAKLTTTRADFAWWRWQFDDDWFNTTTRATTSTAA